MRTRLSSLINWYYERVLGDGSDDHFYFTRRSFEQVVRLAFSEFRLKFGLVPTIKGIYMIAVIDLPESCAAGGPPEVDLDATNVAA